MTGVMVVPPAGSRIWSPDAIIHMEFREVTPGNYAQEVRRMVGRVIFTRVSRTRALVYAWRTEQ